VGIVLYLAYIVVGISLQYDGDSSYQESTEALSCRPSQLYVDTVVWQPFLFVLTRHTNKVQWLHFTGEVDKFITIQRGVYSGFCTPKITKIGSFLTELSKRNIYKKYIHTPAIRVAHSIN